MLIAEDIRHGGDNNEGDDEDGRSGGDDVEELLEPAPPEKRRKVEDATTRDAVAEELRQILDRGGAVAKAKHVRRFYQLMSRERRLKHRLTLLTVVRLTRAPLQQELLNEGLLQVLFRWMSEAKATAERQVSIKLLRPVLEFLTELAPVSLYHTGAGLLQQPHKDLLEALIASPHLDTELRAMTERLLERWNAVGVYPTTTTVDQKISTAAVSSSSLLENRITLENECCDQMLLPEAHVSLHHHHVEAVPPPPPAAAPPSTTTPSSSMIITAKNLESVPPPRSSLVTPSLDVSRVPCSTAASASAIVGERGVRRVEGLNSPFPRAFKQKPLLLVPQSDVPSAVPKRICKTQKRVRWASADSLVSIQLFRESDPPIQLFQSGSGIASSAAAATLAAKHECCTLSTEPDLCSALAPDLKAEVEWLMPIALEIKASWRVQRGEESEEKRNQTNRERHVLAFDPENVIGDIDPDEPYHEDTIQDPKHRSKTITLNNPKDPLPTSKPVQVSSVTPTGQTMTMWPGVVVVPSGPLLFPSAPLQQSASSVPPTVPFMQTPAAGFPLQIPQPVYFVSGIPRSLH